MNKKQTRLAVIAKNIESAAGRQVLAKSMQRPLRTFRDYTGVGRRAFVIDELGRGDIPYYDKDVDVPAYTVGEGGTDVKVEIKADRVFVPLFEIASNPTIPLTQIRERRYDLNDRVKTKVKSEIVVKEDEYVFNLFKNIVDSDHYENDIITTPRAAATLSHFSKAIAQVEKHGDIKCVNIFMNPLNSEILREIHKDYYIDFETSSELMKVGYLANLFGAQIHTSAKVPQDAIYFTGEAEFFGTLVIGQDITVLNADKPEERKIGYSIFEQIGILVHNPNALAVIRLS